MPADLAGTRALREKIRIERDNALAEVRLRVARSCAERRVALRFSGHAHPPPHGPGRRGRRLGFASECAVAVLEFEEFHFVSGKEFAARAGRRAAATIRGPGSGAGPFEDAIARGPGVWDARIMNLAAHALRRLSGPVPSRRPSFCVG